MRKSSRSNTAGRQQQAPASQNATRSALRSTSRRGAAAAARDSSSDEDHAPAQNQRSSVRPRGGGGRSSNAPRSSTRARSSPKVPQANNHDEVIYSKGTYIAYIDASDSLEKFKIGKLLENLREVDDEVEIDSYVESGALNFTRDAAKIPIFEYTIICDINVTEEKPAKRGGKPIVKITRQQVNKINKHMETTVKKIEDENKSEEDSQSSSEEEEEVEEESATPAKPPKKGSKAEIAGRRIVKASTRPNDAPAVVKKNGSAPQKKAIPASQPNVRQVKAASKKLPKVGAKSRKPIAQSDEENEDEESKVVDEDMKDKESNNEEDDSSLEMINTQSKKAPSKRAKSLPKVGSKRIRKAKKGEDDEDEDVEEEEPSGFDGEDEDSASPVKKRKVGAGKAKAEPKPKRAPKRPTEFKKGKWNPHVELQDIDKYKEHPLPEPFIECCIRCNNRNVIRAANTGNERLLKACISAKDKISQLTAFWSPELHLTPVELILRSNNHDLLEILLHPKLHVPQHSNYENERNQFYNDRVGNPNYLINFVDSGNVSHMAYGARVRKVEMTRGNRQGNNAFLQYVDNYNRNPVQQLNDEKLMTVLMRHQSIDLETYKQVFKLNPNFENYVQSYLYGAVRAGNRKLAHFMISNMVKYPNFGFNQLHADVLSDDAVLDKVLRVSVTKKANTNRDITPLHCACINPNPKFLKALMETGPELQTVDTDLKRPVHYAGACEGPEPLKLLIAAGANLTDQDNKKRNCLHYAAMNGRAENIRLILQTSPNLVSIRDRKSMTPIAYACKNGHTEAVKVLLEFKAKLNVGAGQARMTPLMFASAYGFDGLVEYLLDNKARVLGKDKFKRTALTVAVRNGHCKIASLLLQRGSEWYHTDSSMNTPLHYAAAYGWLDCIDLLLKCGADVNAQNSWKISPINIAMLKNHHGCVKRFLEEPNVDVNGKDEKGRTLIMLSLMVLDDESHEFVSYLLRKGADPNIADLEGKTSLHYIAQYVPNQMDSNNRPSRIIYKRQVEIQKKVAQLLISNGAELSAKDKENRTPFAVCLERDNAPLLEFLKDKVSINNEPELFFAFKNKIFNVEYQRILEQLLQNEAPTKETINFLDKNGLTPFLAYVEAFCQHHDQLLTTISHKVNQQSFIHGNNRAMYQLTNEDVFDRFAADTNYYNYNPSFTQEEKMALAKEFFDKIITRPFINILKVLLGNGADPQARVGKLKRYREIEEQKRQELIQLAAGEQQPVMAVDKKKEEKVLRREEKLMEMNKKRAQKVMKRRAGAGYPYAGIQLQSQPTDLDTGKDTYDKINGEKVLREYGPTGLRNAVHFLTQQPNKTMFNFLVEELEINPDEPDYDEVTPFNLFSQSQVSNIDESHIFVLNAFLKKDVRIDYPNRKGRTAFLNFYEKQNFELSYRMLDLGANVNQMDASGLFALKYALIRRQNNSIQKLLDLGANINQIDNKGRNLLHHAINMSSATADATFETEQFLIERGVNINLRDGKNRTPLHYAFVKIQDWKTSTQIDPIETVSSLCGCKGLEIDVPDKWEKTPLHYASQRGASICAMYLVQRGAKLEAKDIYGNTPLGVGLMYQHYNYGIILIQKGASVHPLSFREEPDRIKKQWEDEAKAKKMLYKTQKKAGLKAAQSKEELSDEDMEEDSPQKFAVHVEKKHQNMFANANHGIQYYDEEDYDDEDDNSEDSDDDHQEQIFNQQNAFGMQVYQNNGLFGGRARPATRAYNPYGGGFGFGANNMMAAAQPAQPQQGGALIKETDKEGVSMFKLSIRGGQQGLAYLMLDNGYDLMHAMQDAMDEKKFMLVLTLLSKNPDDHVIQSKNVKGQNLFHILSMNASSCALEHLQRIYDALQKRGVDCRAKDNFGRTALHYAVIGGSTSLVKMLLTQAGGYDPNEIDNEGHTPLTLYIKGPVNTSHQLYNPAFKHENIFYLLAKAGANVNIVYPEPHYKPALKEEDLLEEHLGEYEPKGQYYCTPLIHLLRLNPQNETMRNNLIGMIEFGAKPDVVDSDGRDPLMHAIMKNNVMVIRLILENQKRLPVNTSCQDKAGRSACHYVVNPVGYGSYENTEILELLHKYHFALDLKDAHGKTPAHYAAEQESGVMLNELAKILGKQDQLNNLRRQISMVQTSNWPEAKVDYEADSEQYMELAGEREALLAKEKNQRVPVDKTGKFEVSYEVYYDERDQPWDVYLTKVDLKNGIYGDYVFYKMQLLYDTNRDLYVVFTRYGRIGETGMNQRTPFNKVDEAKDEFKKIFKQKTGGNNFEELDKFSRVKKKYNLTRINYVTVDMKDYLQPFDYDQCPRSRLRQEIYDLFSEISNVTMYQRAFTSFGIDTNVLPFSGVKKQSLIEARQILQEIQEQIKEDIEISKEGIKADFDKLTAVKERISELSSRYYELIPQERYKNQIAPPLNNQHSIKTQYDLLETLTNIEFASKVLLGALLKQKEMNPVDYVYHAMNMMIEPLEKETPEYETIFTYIDNTRNKNDVGGGGIFGNYQMHQNQYEIANIFKIQRKGEAESIQAYNDVPNHFLLFHGSQMFNFIGILSQGLKIAPPEAPATGYMFGKGVYFADMYDKSFAYAARGYGQQESYLMLMCEVVVGKAKELTQAQYIEKLEPPFHSVKGCGQRGPGYKHTITLPNGVKIPFGPVINYFENNQEKARQMSLQHNEYIVYNTQQIRMRYVIQIQKKKPQDANKK